MKLKWAFLKKFLNRVLVVGKDHCWQWLGRVNSDGYGTTSPPGGGSISAHRLAWIVEHGEIPEGKHVLHSCDNPGCVNPSHLFLGDQKRNMEDMVAKKRSGRLVGSSNGNSRISEADVARIKKMIAEGAKRKTVALEFGVHTSTIDRISYGRNWTHVR